MKRILIIALLPILVLVIYQSKVLLGDTNSRTQTPNEPNKILSHDQIKVMKIKQHPFLVDHCRKLVTVDSHQNIIDEVPLNVDTGSGCDAWLYRNPLGYTLIDCNGFWFSMDKATGKITKQGWQWNKDLPQQWVGAFVRGNGEDKAYNLIVMDTIPTKEMVYKEKDPNPNDCK